MQQRILIQGEFSTEELRELMEAIRKIEQRHPEREYHMMLLDEQPDQTAMETIAQIFPVDPSRGVDLTFLPRTDKAGH